MDPLQHHLTKFLFVGIVIVAFIDGFLVAQKWENKQDSPLAADEAVQLEELYYPVVEAPKLSVLPPQVPFISQAPLGDWKSPWNEYAEEAVILMVEKYGKTLVSARQTATELLELDTWITENLGPKKNLSAPETLEVLQGHLGVQARLTEELTESSLKAALEAGYLIILPVNGRALGNPYFTPPGPEHHMVLVIGQTQDGFLVHDPGTSRGENTEYQTQTLIAAIQDLDGSRVGILLTPEL